MQSSVSRNLAMLREAGFVRDRKEGTSVYFSVRADMPEPARELFESLQTKLGEIPEVKKDQARLEECRRRRLHRSRSYFESVAGDWERIRKSYFDDRVTSLAIEKLLAAQPYVGRYRLRHRQFDLRAGAFRAQSHRCRSIERNAAARSRHRQGARVRQRRISPGRRAQAAVRVRTVSMLRFA